MIFKQITLLTGSNGRGKSSILQSLLILAQSFQSGKNIEFVKLNGRFVCLGTYNDVLSKGVDTNNFSIAFKSDDPDENDVIFTCMPLDGKNRLADLKSLLISYIDGEKKELINNVGSNDDDSNSISATTKGSTSAIAIVNQLRNFYYVSANRVGPTNYVTPRNDEVNGNQIGIHGEYVINTLKESEESLVKQVAAEISSIMGGASVKVDEIDTEYLKLLLDSQDNNEGFKPVNVGFGYSYILPLVVLPLVVEPNSKLILENPEAHLHPGAQSRLMKFLIRIAKEKKLQLFIETHSDHIINALRIAVKDSLCQIIHKDATIIHVGRDKTSEDSIFWQINIDSYGNLSDYPNEFMDEWTNQMLNLV